MLRNLERHPRYRPVRAWGLFAIVVLLSRPFVAEYWTNGDRQQPANPSIGVTRDDLAMARAFAKAAQGLDDFLAKWRDPPAGSTMFSVKIGLRDVAGSPGYELVRPGTSVADAPVEWVWMNALRRDGEGFQAEIDNDPDTIMHVKSGQTVHFTRQDIGDWTYFQDGKIVGNVTACPALEHGSPEQRSMMRVKFGLRCE